MNLLDEINRFEGMLSEALQYKYDRSFTSLSSEQRGELIKILPVKQMNIRDFYKLYLVNLTKGIYPKERLPKLIAQLFDIKIQLFCIMELDIGLYNHLIYDLGFDKNSIDKCPYIALRKISLDQTMIVKSRILWERIMNFIYCLETGKDLGDRKSKKTHFFQFIENTKWAYLEDYKQYIYRFDDKLRTSEVHEGSMLRKYFQQELLGTAHELERINGLVNIVMNAIWINLLSIIQGKEPSSRFWTIEMEGLAKEPKLD
ncbi:MAG: hypothetical protein ABSB38_06330 [Dehalococcoidia bacterium]|jgi:hypothetical protein